MMPFLRNFCDIANDLLHCSEWDPEELHSLPAKDIELPELLPSLAPFAQALPLDVDIPPDPQGYTYVFIYDLISVGIILLTENC